MSVHKVTGKAVFISKSGSLSPIQSSRDKALKDIFDVILDAPAFLQSSFIQGGHNALISKMYTISDDTTESEDLDTFLSAVDHYHDIVAELDEIEFPTIEMTLPLQETNEDVNKE